MAIATSNLSVCLLYCETAGEFNSAGSGVAGRRPARLREAVAFGDLREAGDSLSGAPCGKRRPGRRPDRLGHRTTLNRPPFQFPIPAQATGTRPAAASLRR